MHDELHRAESPNWDSGSNGGVDAPDDMHMTYEDFDTGIFPDRALSPALPWVIDPVLLEPAQPAPDGAAAPPQIPGDRTDDEDEDEPPYQDQIDPDGPPPESMPMHSAAPGESSAVRYVYLSAALNRTFRGLTYDRAERGMLDMFKLLKLVGKFPTDAVPKPATTLVTAMRRIRLDPDACIINYASCPLCWKMISPSQLLELPSPTCPADGCAGIIYTERRNAKNKLVRIPERIVPYVSLIESLRRMFLRPGFADKIRDSRHDNPAEFEAEDFLKEGMHHGLAWSVPRTRQKRAFDADGNFHDRPAHPDRQTPLLTSHRYGLHIGLNIDWCLAVLAAPHVLCAHGDSLSGCSSLKVALTQPDRSMPLSMICRAQSVCCRAMSRCFWSPPVRRSRHLCK